VKPEKQKTLLMICLKMRIREEVWRFDKTGRIVTKPAAILPVERIID